MKPRISVCIANYNGIELIDMCIQSVLMQIGLDAEQIEILIHDDASSDGSPQSIRNYYPQAKLIESTQNVGFCVANNRMAAMARGDYLLLLNNDAILFPDALATLLVETEHLGRPAILTLPQFDAVSGELLDIGCRLDPFLNPVPNRCQDRSNVGTVHGACLWIDKSLWDEMGGFPDWFGSVGEDLYLCCRVRLAGYPVSALGISGYRHYVGQSFGGGKARNGKLVTTFRRRALSERNKTLVLAVTCPAPFLQLLLPLHLMLLLAEGVLLSLFRFDIAYLWQIYLPVFPSLIRLRHQLFATRRKIAQQRRLASADYFEVFDWMPYKLRMLLRHGLPSVR